MVYDFVIQALCGVADYREYTNNLSSVQCLACDLWVCFDILLAIAEQGEDAHPELIKNIVIDKVGFVRTFCEDKFC
jgi:hypothetical protein